MTIYTKSQDLVSDALTAGQKFAEELGLHLYELDQNPLCFRSPGVPPWNKGLELEEWDKQKKSSALKQYHKENPDAAKQRAKRSEESCSKVRKKYKLVSPDGVNITTNHLLKFCREHNLNQGNMVSVASGRLKSHKGWKCFRT
jgi:hypothetical protein